MCTYLEANDGDPGGTVCCWFVSLVDLILFVEELLRVFVGIALTETEFPSKWPIYSAISYRAIVNCGGSLDDGAYILAQWAVSIYYTIWIVTSIIHLGFIYIRKYKPLMYKAVTPYVSFRVIPCKLHGSPDPWTDNTFFTRGYKPPKCRFVIPKRSLISTAENLLS